VQRLPRNEETALERTIERLFHNVERYVMPLLGSEEPNQLSKQENLVLALQNINNLNILIGKIARGSKDEFGNLHLLQMYVNNLTVALKNDNVPLMRSSIASIRNVIQEIYKSS
jgi:hypothetical protein